MIKRNFKGLDDRLHLSFECILRRDDEYAEIRNQDHEYQEQASYTHGSKRSGGL